ncbi:MAG TPA: peptide MFS transporter [Steroidobacteraceae bacterium]|nr:peptide MFS transporter [Steroidobacteraceae bacterium]
MSQSADASLLAPAAKRTILGQPIGIATLFLTELWERFTYYGIQSLLILFMVAPAAKGGLGLDDKSSASIYGLYVGSTYLLGLLGGWIADRLAGAQRAVIAGGILIALGNTLLALGTTAVFFVGLLVIAMGVGLLKPNVSALVAALYPEGGARRDAGFSIFYMGINTGGFLGPVVVPLIATALGWRFGFALTALGMVLGVGQFLVTRRFLGGAGIAVAPEQRASWTPVVALFVLLAAAVLLAVSGAVRIDSALLASFASWAFALLAVAYFGYLLFFAGLAGTERRRVMVMVALFLGSVTFWAGYFQQGASFNLFAARYTDMHILGWNAPPGILQSLDSLFVIILAGAFAALWLALGRRDRDPPVTAKFGVALLLLGVGFLVMYFAARHVLAGRLVLPTWLVSTYFLHVCGEMCLSPVGLSNMSKLVPPRFVGQAMGMWFLSLALGGNLAGQLTGEYDASHLDSLPALFLRIFWYGAIAGVVMLLLTPLVKRLMAGVT